MSNFAFLAAEFLAVHEAALAAERHAAGDPTAAAFCVGTAVDIAILSPCLATSARTIAMRPVARRETIGYRLPS